MLVDGDTIPVLTAAGTASHVDGVVRDSNGKSALTAQYRVGAKQDIPSDSVHLELSINTSSPEIMEVCALAVAASNLNNGLNTMYRPYEWTTQEIVENDDGTFTVKYIFPVSDTITSGSEEVFTIGLYAVETALETSSVGANGIIYSIDASMVMGVGATA